MPYRTRPPRARRRLITARACAATAAALLLLTGTPVSAAPAAADAQIVDDEAFLSNGFVEIGSRPNGSFGSNHAAPAGYHPRHGANRLGFRADRDKDGWGTGTDDGDFFTPGGPYEGWGIQVGNGGTARWNHHTGTDIDGAHGGEAAAAGAAHATWTSVAPVDGISVTQVSRVPADALFLDVDVTLTNTTGAAMTDVYYVRAVDPDNCATVTDPVCDGDGDGVGETAGEYTTHNTVVSQVRDGDGASVVSATQTDGSYIDLRTDATGSVVAMGTAGDFCTDPAGLHNFFANPPAVASCDVTTTVGAEVFTDDVIYLVVRTPTLAAGASRTFRFQYLLAASAAAATPQTITFPEPGAPRADGTIVLAATSTSGLPITYATRTADVCTVADAVVTPVRTGTCTIAASQGGDGSYAPAPEVLLSFDVVAPAAGGGGGSGEAPGGLPITGAPVVATAVVGSLLLGLGIAGYVVARRRRVRFQA